MTGLRALVLDDELPVRRYLAELLAGTSRVEPVAVVGSVAEATAALATEPALDVVFADVRLIERAGDQSGLHWARALAAGPAPPLVVIATALADHALEAFELGAIDYLLKPFTRSRVATCVDRLCARRVPPVTPAATRLLARDPTSLVFLSLAGVLAYEAAERLVHVHHLDGRFLVDLSLAGLEHQFAGQVLRTHRNWLVVPEHVRQLGRRGGELVVLLGPELAVPVSRDRAPAVREALLAHAIGARR